MVHVKLLLLILFLVPVVTAQLDKIQVGTNNGSTTSAPTVTTAKTTAKATLKATSKATLKTTENATVNTNVSVQPSSVGTSVQPSSVGITPRISRSNKFGDMIKRLTIVGAILTAIVAIYFIVRFTRSGRRKARKYGVVKTPGDLEMRPLDADDEDDDEDVTMFNRKN